MAGEYDPDAIAIVGMACRAPGATSPSELWRAIEEGHDLGSKMPSDRFNIDAIYHPDPAHKGHTNARFGYYLKQDLGVFDNGFFNISGNEARAMDPQQRLGLEVVYEAFEHARIPMNKVYGSSTAVVAGSFSNDYRSTMFKDTMDYPKYAVSGIGNSILSNRISYILNLKGPSLSVDTACSASLYAFVLGADAIRTGHCTQSVIMGSALHYDNSILATTDFGMFSTDGRSRTFDAKGKGYARGEGVIAVVIKRVGQALADGDTIYSVLRGSGINHDGKKNGITLPNGAAQEALIRKVYADACLNMAETKFFEAHGTGTAAGDPIESNAIGRAFAGSIKDGEKLWVGSIKNLMGHLEGASGLVSVIKTTLAVYKGIVPRNILFEDPNPNIDFEKLRIAVPERMMPWPTIDGPRRASVSSYGYGGANAHIVLEAAETYLPKELLAPSYPRLPSKLRNAQAAHQRPYLLMLSSHSEKAGKLLLAKFSDFIRAGGDSFSLEDLAYTLSERRTVHPLRAFAVADTTTEAADALASPPPHASFTSNRNDSAPRLGFVFTGQGGQWYAMGRELIKTSPLFLQSLNRCNDILKALPDGPSWNVVDELMKSKAGSRLGQTSFSQPLCTALQLALLQQLSSYGIAPSRVAGHSSGEIAAAYAAGIITFEEAIVIAYYRGLYMSTAPDHVEVTPGGMMAVGASEQEAAAMLKPYPGRLCIGAVNSPSSVTISGDKDAIQELKATLTLDGVFARELIVAQAFHSHHMQPFAPAYEKALRSYGLKPKASSLPMHSSVTSHIADGVKLDASYWVTNMVSPVMFSNAITGMIPEVDILVEIGPHPALKGPSRQCLAALDLDGKVPYIASLTRNEHDYKGVLSLAGQLFARGYPVDLVKVNALEAIDINNDLHHLPGKVMHDLPTYAWDHSNRYWAQSRWVRDTLHVKERSHDLLGLQNASSTSVNRKWRSFIRVRELPWLQQHKVDGAVLFPAAGYITMALEAARQYFSSQPYAEGNTIHNFHITNLVLRSAMVLADSETGTETLFELRPCYVATRTMAASQQEFTISSYGANGEWVEHCRGRITVNYGPEACPSIAPIVRTRAMDQASKGTHTSADVSKTYSKLTSIGLDYGPLFQGLKSLEIGAGYTIGSLELPSLDEAMPYGFHSPMIVHPTLLDSAFHLLFPAMESVLGKQLQEPYVPTWFRNIVVSGKMVEGHPIHFQGYTEVTLTSPRAWDANIRIYDDSGRDILVEIDQAQLLGVGSRKEEDETGRSLFFQTRWAPDFDDITTENAALLDAKDLQTALAKIVDIWAHKYADGSILFVDAQSNGVELARVALTHLGGSNGDRRRFKKMTFSSFGQDDPEDLSTAISPYSSLVESTPFEKIPAESTFDLIIINASGIGADELARVKSLLCPTSFIVSIGSIIDDYELDDVFNIHSIHVTRPLLDSTKPHRPLVVITSSTSSSVNNAIVETLKRNHQRIEVLPVQSVSESRFLKSQEHTDVLVLANLDTDIFFDDNSPALFENFQKLFSGSHRNIVWATQGAFMECTHPQHAIVPGMVRSIRSENELIRAVILDLECGHYTADAAIKRLLHALHPPPYAVDYDEVAERKGLLFIPRLVANDDLNSTLPNGFRRQPRLEPLSQKRRLALKIPQVGALESLAFSDVVDSAGPIGDGEIEVAVEACGLSARDVAVATGSVRGHHLGEECSGTVLATGKNVSNVDFPIGSRVCVWRPGQGAIMRRLRTPVQTCHVIPSSMSFESAAVFPISATTALYSLCHVAHLHKEDTILIHNGSGAVGQKAIQIAQSIGARIFTTCSEKNRDSLKELFGLNDSQIFSSRDDSFVADVMQATGHRGVDVILNSLSGDLLHKTLGCLAPFGRFVQIGRKDVDDGGELSLEHYRQNVTFSSVDMISIYKQNLSLGRKLLSESFDYLAKGVFKAPVRVTAYSFAEAPAAFRSIHQGKNTGKIVLTAHDDLLVPVLPSQPRPDRRLFDANKTYLLVGGLGGLGRSVAEWIARFGGRHIAFLSRSGANSKEALTSIDWLRKKGVDVSLYKGDVCRIEDVTSVVKSIQGSSAPLGGVFQAAVAIRDAPFEQMSYDQFKESLDPKVKGTWNLHNATLNIPLEFFIGFSSRSAIVGAKAQSNYSGGNAFIDALLIGRRHKGLRGATMNCGMIVGIGLVAQDAELEAIMIRQGFDPVTESEFLAQVEEAVTRCRDQSEESEALRAAGYELNQSITGMTLSSKSWFWTDKPYMRNLYANHDFADGSSDAGSVSIPLSQILRSELTHEERASTLLEAFTTKLSILLAIDQDAVDGKNALAAYGLDSIVALELRNWFFKQVGADIAVFNILGAKSINDLVEFAIELIEEELAGAKAE